MSIPDNASTSLGIEPVRKFHAELYFLNQGNRKKSKCDEIEKIYKMCEYSWEERATASSMWY